MARGGGGRRGGGGIQWQLREAAVTPLPCLGGEGDGTTHFASADPPLQQQLRHAAR